jgi:hypothetical protein
MTLRRFAILALLPLGLAGCDAPKPSDVSVTLLMHNNENDPISGGKLKLIFDGVATNVVTDAQGHASFATKASISRTWHWVNVAFTPFSRPIHADLLTFSAELEHSVSIEGRVVYFPVLYKMQIFCYDSGECSNEGPRVFGRDANGNFTIDLDRGNTGIPIAGKTLVAPNNGYRVVGSYGNPATDKPLKLDLDIVQEHWSQAQ